MAHTTRTYMSEAGRRNGETPYNIYNGCPHCMCGSDASNTACRACWATTEASRILADVEQADGNTGYLYGPRAFAEQASFDPQAEMMRLALVASLAAFVNDGGRAC